eukprot:3441180-Prymnesium_polylepis.1
MTTTWCARVVPSLWSRDLRHVCLSTSYTIIGERSYGSKSSADHHCKPVQTRRDSRTISHNVGAVRHLQQHEEIRRQGHRERLLPAEGAVQGHKEEIVLASDTVGTFEEDGCSMIKIVISCGFCTEDCFCGCCFCGPMPVCPIWMCRGCAGACKATNSFQNQGQPTSTNSATRLASSQHLPAIGALTCSSVSLNS